MHTKYWLKKATRRFCLFSLYVATVFSGWPVLGQQIPFYPQLEKGSYEIGFKTFIDFDYARTYNLKYPNETGTLIHDPRPVVITMWYPASVHPGDTPLQYGDYIKMASSDVSLKNFLDRIEAYNLRNSSQYMFYEDSLDVNQIKSFADHLDRPVRVYKNASPVQNKFPLVIYHAGLGGTLNDNTILCEYLASHGFVVMSGAFQNNDYTNVNLNWDLERSTKDIDFMLNAIKHLPFIDFTKIAGIGHSYGGQAMLGYRTEDFSPVSWLIILDSTMDYSLDASPEGFRPLTDKLYRKIDNMSVPMLIFADPTATFKVIDSLKGSDRIYVTLDLGHNEYTSLTSFAVMHGLQNRQDRDMVWNKYVLINEYCLHYLKAQIFNDASAKQYILSKNPLLDYIYEIPKGTSLNTNIPDYSDFSHPPSSLQLQMALRDKNKEVLNVIIKNHPAYFNENVINSAGYRFLEEDFDFALYLFQKNVDVHPDSWNVYDSLGEAYMIKGEKELAIKNYKISVDLNPENENGRLMLEKLK